MSVNNSTAIKNATIDTGALFGCSGAPTTGGEAQIIGGGLGSGPI